MTTAKQLINQLTEGSYSEIQAIADEFRAVKVTSRRADQSVTIRFSSTMDAAAFSRAVKKKYVTTMSLQAGVPIVTV